VPWRSVGLALDEIVEPPLEGSHTEVDVLVVVITEMEPCVIIPSDVFMRATSAEGQDRR
jgi:hypothetical protein